MPRAIWSGAISFGLVNVPVKLYSATSPKAVRFHQLSGRTGARIKQQRIDSSTGEEVAFEDIVKGYELGDDRYVLIEPGELESLDPKATRTIDIEDFVDLDQIDPIYFDHTYYLVPSAGGAKAYRLLLDAMRASGRVAIGRIVLRTKQQLCALRPVSGEGGRESALGLSTMLFGDEVLRPDGLDELDQVADAEASDRELKMAQQLIDTLSGKFDPGKYRDEYRDRVLDLIERKASGEQITAPPEAEEATLAPDLMAALEASLASVHGGSSDTPADAAPRKPPKAPARKRAPKSSGSATRRPTKSR